MDYIIEPTYQRRYCFFFAASRKARRILEGILSQQLGCFAIFRDCFW